MRKRFLGVISGLTMLFTASSALGAMYNFDRPHAIDSLIVKFRSDITPPRKGHLLQTIDGQLEHRLRAAAADVIRLPRLAQMAGRSLPQARALLRQIATRLDQHPAVEWVEANAIIHLSAVPDDPQYDDLYGLAQMDLERAWEVSTGSHDVVIGVIDTGVDGDHPDLKANMWVNPGESGEDADGNDKRTNGIDDDGNGYIDDFRGWDFVNDDNDPNDGNGHGTHCAGTIGAVGNNGVGVTGVAWEVSLVGIKFLSAAGSGETADAVRAIEYATTLGLTATSNSWGGGGFSKAMYAAIKEAQAAGIGFVAAAGNSASDNDVVGSFPASYDLDNIVAVAATDADDALAGFSSYGRAAVDLAAPGVDILSTYPKENTRYKKLSGTSMATPHVAGAVALVKAVFPNVTFPEIKARLLGSVDPIEALGDKMLTGGRLNVFDAIEPDTIPPGLPGALQQAATGLTDVTLSFVAAGDDGDAGQAKNYQVRLSKTPVATEADWEAAFSPYAGWTLSSDPTQSVTISGLPLNYQGFATVRAVDNVGNRGALGASLAVATRPATIALREAAETLDNVDADYPWGLEDALEGQGFGDSPGRDYANHSQAGMVWKAPVAAEPDMEAMWFISYDFETGYDFGIIDVKIGQRPWESVAKVTGASGGFLRHRFKLADVVDDLQSGEKLQLRFRLQTDFSITSGGMTIDNITLYRPE